MLFFISLIIRSFSIPPSIQVLFFQGKNSDSLLLIIIIISLPPPFAILVKHYRRRLGRPSQRVDDDLTPQRGADLLDAARLPLAIPAQAERVQDEIVAAGDELARVRGRAGGDDLELGGELLAVLVQREVVDVVAEGVLDLVADGGEAEDDVCGDCFHSFSRSDSWLEMRGFFLNKNERVGCLTDRARDGDPAQGVEQLERQDEDVHPRDLRNGDRVGDGQRGVQDPFGPRKDFVQ